MVLSVEMVESGRRIIDGEEFVRFMSQDDAGNWHPVWINAEAVEDDIAVWVPTSMLHQFERVNPSTGDIIHVAD